MHFTGEAAAGGAPGPAPWTRRRRLGPRAVRPPLPLGARSAGGGGRWTLRRAPLPSPPDGDAPGTAGQAPPLPFGLYLTGLEALRRSHSFSKGIWFRARVISQNPLAFDTPPPPPRYLPPPPFPFCLPPLSPDDRSAVFRGVALARAQGIPTPARFPVWTGFQRCDQGCFPGDTSLGRTLHRARICTALMPRKEMQNATVLVILRCF